ncbi:uncharacterized protein A4U43_C01F20340 [Asparagus officinalis]|uniref:Uncharacterized protein n=1 Tax=Asparagus officinalis TaxID=4686 RepID=A0A5P1FRM2_ASPOF|nr:transcription factor MYB1R1-like [Asparagus officinalis]ONK80664.1 uncharacterized protein A4U43_C01F20340 [Asparagus officinalis]
MKKSASMGNLSSSSSSSAHFNNPGSPGSDPTRDHDRSGYASDDPTHASCSSSNCRSERKKGTPWTEEEHRMFLLGLQKLGKGDWRGIARNFVVSRTPTQVASHAQKYFIRQTNASRRKRRSSLFDMVPEMQMDQLQVLDEKQHMLRSPTDPDTTNHLQSLHLLQDQETEPAEKSSITLPPEIKETVTYSNIPLPPGHTFYPTAFIPMPYPFWPPTPAPQKAETTTETHEVLKPTPILPKESKNVDEVVGMSKLSIGEGTGSRMEPSALSLKLMDSSADSGRS